MKALSFASLLGTLLLCGQTWVNAQALPGTELLTWEGDLATRMVAGIDQYLSRELDGSVRARATHWTRDFSSEQNYTNSIVPNRQRFREITGLVDELEKVQMQFIAPVPSGGEIFNATGFTQLGSGSGYRIYAVRWNVFRGVEAEGLLLQPDGTAIADIVALPDCDWTPEMLVGLEPGVPVEGQFARRLAENGCRVLVPLLIDRSDTNSGLPGVRHLRQTQREVLWRAAYEMGRTMIGYEVQKVLAAANWFRQNQDAESFSNQDPKLPTGGRKIGVIGYGEGGLLALYAAAADVRIASVAVSGYFQPREAIHTEPIYRNVWSLLEEFGDAEIVGLVVPRAVVIEAGKYPETEYPKPGEKHDGAAPGKLILPKLQDVEQEVTRSKAWVKGLRPVPSITLVECDTNTLGTDQTLTAFLGALGNRKPLVSAGTTPQHTGQPVDKPARLLRQYSQILEDTQHLMREAEFTRKKFWSKADRKNVETFEQTSRWYKDYFGSEIIGSLPKPSLPPNPRTRLIYETAAFKAYEVVLDVYPDVFAFGALLIPKDLTPNERRPVVVCQHGLEGRPRDVADPKIDNPAYHAYACRLAERGFITFAPQNPYIGQNSFRQVLRKAQPLKKTLFAFIVRQHESILGWLASQSFVDPKRMAFYGLSYGGKTAMRIPPLLDQYCLSICSADYNEWIWKNVSARHNYSYLYWGEYDMPEFNLGNTFNYAEMSWLIFPRPFMVERGHDDGVAPDEWVDYEFAKTRRHYVKMGLGNRTTIEHFDGPHTINGKGTFEFLHQQLDWPKKDN